MEYNQTDPVTAVLQIGFKKFHKGKLLLIKIFICKILLNAFPAGILFMSLYMNTIGIRCITDRFFRSRRTYRMRINIIRQFSTQGDKSLNLCLHLTPGILINKAVNALAHFISS